jgi:putative transposase
MPRKARIDAPGALHLNPVQAGTVEDMDALRGHPRSGHSALMGKIICDWQDTDYVLGLFGDTQRAARKAYQGFVAKGLPDENRPERVGGGLIRSAGGWGAVTALRHSGMRIMGDKRILGSRDFVASVLQHAGEQIEKRTLAQRKGVGLDTLIGKVADHFGLEPADLGSPGRQRLLARARSLICALAAERLGSSGRKLARWITPSDPRWRSCRG